MVNKSKLILLAIGSLLILFLFILSYVLLLSPVNPKGEDMLFEIKPGSSMRKVAVDLESKGLIRNSTIFRLYAKLNSIDTFKAGYYNLYPSMSSEEVAKKIEKGEVVYPHQVKVTFPEGLTLIEMADILSQHIDYSKDEILSRWNKAEFVNELTSRFYFITNEINHSSISYPLNGYLFPETYFLSDKGVTPEEVAIIMLERLKEVLSNFSHEIETQKLSYHEILTLASIIEYEAKFDEDRPMISGVFHNRLTDNMKLESCATLQMATGVHKKIYSKKDTKIKSPYNTYYVSGLPIGPGNCPGAKSIKAALKPASHSYYYFLSDIYGDSKTYYATTLQEHNTLKNKYLK